MSDDTGVLLGVNRYNNSLCIVDLFNTKMHKNANLVLLGTSGAGKTFTMQLLALRMRMRGIQCFIIAPIKGHEFRRACDRIGGEFIRIAPGSPHCINIMEIRHTLSPEMELLDGIDYSETDSLLARKIQQLMTFFGLLIPDMSNEEEHMLGCTDDVTAEYFSERSGDMSIRISSTMTVRKTMAVAQVIPEYRQTQGQGKHRLLTPDEVLRLPNDELLVVIRGHNILRLKKLDYTRLPMSGEIVKTSLMDYAPTPASASPAAKAPAVEEPAPRKRRGLYSSAKPPEGF